jgi:hypothetical protein
MRPDRRRQLRAHARSSAAGIIDSALSSMDDRYDDESEEAEFRAELGRIVERIERTIPARGGVR